MKVMAVAEAVKRSKTPVINVRENQCSWDKKKREKERNEKTAGW